MAMTDSALSIEQKKPAPPVKGPRVWLDMDQQELDAAYDQSKYAPNQAQVHARRLANSALARAMLGEPLRLAYGAAAIEQLDVYRVKRANAPVNVFIHGGAWRGGNKSGDIGMLLPFAATANYFCASVGYRLSSWRARAGFVARLGLTPLAAHRYTVAEAIATTK